MTNVERCSKKETLLGIARFTQTVTVTKCHEENLEQYKCDTCEKTFSQKQYLKLHMDIHTGAPRKQCKYCDKDFSDKIHLRRHVKKCHPTPKVIENTHGFIMLEKKS